MTIAFSLIHIYCILVIVGLWNVLSFHVAEYYQSSKIDTSVTEKEIISSFQRLGVSFNLDQVNFSALFDSNSLWKAEAYYFGERIIFFRCYWLYCIFVCIMFYAYVIKFHVKYLLGGWPKELKITFSISRYRRFETPLNKFKKWEFQKNI